MAWSLPAIWGHIQAPSMHQQPRNQHTNHQQRLCAAEGKVCCMRRVSLTGSESAAVHQKRRVDDREVRKVCLSCLFAARCPAFSCFVKREETTFLLFLLLLSSDDATQQGSKSPLSCDRAMWEFIEGYFKFQYRPCGKPVGSSHSVFYLLNSCNSGRLKTLGVSAKRPVRSSTSGQGSGIIMAAQSPQNDEFQGEAIKLATVELAQGVTSVGIVRGDFFWPYEQMLSLSDEGRNPVRDMNDLIHAWDAVVNKLNYETFETKGIPLSEVKLLAPIPRPTGTIMCIGKNYLDHVKEVDKFPSGKISNAEAPQYPIVFTKAPQSVIGPGAAIRYPHGASSQVDYEAELGVIIKTAGRAIKKEDAMRHVLGYTIINDITARDMQRNHQQWFLGKSCDTFCPMGPWIVPSTEVNGRDLKIECWINDELRQSGRTSQMLFGIPELIEVISAAITIQPGDVIATGTPAGVGSGFNPPKHLKPGDRVRIRIEGIGELINTVE